VKIVSHVHGIGGTAAVTADIHLAPLDPGSPQIMGHGLDLIEDYATKATV
jgi:hypothetical protein